MGAREHYLCAYQAIEPSLPGRHLPWLSAQRQRAIARFAEIGFPGAHEEAWKYTRVASIEKHALQPSPTHAEVTTAVELRAHEVLGDDCHRMVFVNGRHSPRLSRLGEIDGAIRVVSLREALAREPQAIEPHLGRYADTGSSGFSALNTAFMDDGACIRLSSGTNLDQPLVLEFVFTQSGAGASLQPRVLIVAGAHSQAKIVEHHYHLANAVYLSNAITEVILEDGAHIEHYKLQDEGLQAFHVATLQVHQERDSHFISHSVSLGGALTRNDINAVMDAAGTECELNGLYMATGKQHVDYHTRIDHAKPHGTSREYYKGVLDGRARGVFNGQIHVHPQALKTDARQTNDNLLLSRHAEVDTKPQLEIYADDVKCSHGATVGQLDEQMVFYLRSRGIDEGAARGLLIYGFASDVLARMSLPPMRACLESRLLSWLPNAEEVRGLVR